jgi:hypothetical protein
LRSNIINLISLFLYARNCNSNAYLQNPRCYGKFRIKKIDQYGNSVGLFPEAYDTHEASVLRLSLLKRRKKESKPLAPGASAPKEGAETVDAKPVKKVGAKAPAKPKVAKIEKPKAKKK